MFCGREKWGDPLHPNFLHHSDHLLYWRMVSSWLRFSLFVFVSVCVCVEKKYNQRTDNVIVVLLISKDLGTNALWFTNRKKMWGMNLLIDGHSGLLFQIQMNLYCSHSPAQLCFFAHCLAVSISSPLPSEIDLVAIFWGKRRQKEKLWRFGGRRDWRKIALMGLMKGPGGQLIYSSGFDFFLKKNILFFFAFKKHRKY